MKHYVQDVMDFINRNDEWRIWYKLLRDENVLDGKECEDMLGEYGVAGVMGLRRLVFERQLNRVGLRELESAKDREQLRLSLQRLFLEPITGVQMGYIVDRMNEKNMTLEDLYIIHIGDLYSRILRVLQ